MSLASKNPVQDVATLVASDKIYGTFRSTSIGEITFLSIYIYPSDSGFQTLHAFKSWSLGW